MNLAERLPYEPITTRAPLRWPGESRLAVWIAPNIEHYEYQPAEIGPRDPWPRQPHPDVLGYATRDYGNRVGFWRLLDLLDRLEIRCTVSLSMAVMRLFPELIAAMEARGWDYMSHGLYNTRYHWNYSIEQERAAIAECCAIHEECTQRPLRGWFSPGVSFTDNTPDLVAEAGIEFIADLYHDDQPTWVRTRSGRLASMPYTLTLNDWVASRRPAEGADFARWVIDWFDTVYAEGTTQGRVMCIALHPYWIATPARIGHLARALAHIRSHPDVWFARATDIFDWWKAQTGTSA